MPQRTEYRFCNYKEEDVPVHIQIYKSKNSIVTEIPSCDEAWQCKCPNCSWKSKRPQPSDVDYLRI